MNTFSIKDICKIGSSKRIFASEYTKKGIPFFRSTEVIELANKKTFVPDFYISENKYSEIAQKFPVPQNSDILIAAIGANMGTLYFVNLNYKFYFKDGNVIWLREFENTVNPKYLYYWLTTQKGYKELCNTAIGSAQRALTIDKIGNIKFKVPNINVQQHIVDIIGSLDDKIENNNKLYKKIDEYLLLKYKKIQDKTGKGNFKDNFNILNGYAFKSKDYIEFGTYNVITIKNIKSDGFTTASCDFIDFNDDYRKVKLNIGDILLTMTGDVGRVGIVDQENCLLNQRVLKVTGISPAYTYAFLKSNYYNISMISKGSVQQNLSVNDLYNISVYNSKQQIFEFKKYDSLFEKMVALKKENIKLQQLKLNYLAKFF